MSRHLFAVVAVVALACSALAQEPKLVQPKPPAAPPKGEMAKRLAEEVESIEAHLATKKAYIVAAQVAVKAAEHTLNQSSILGATARDEAKLGLEAAKAHLVVREAEANEVAVKLKHAKRRAEDAQKADAGSGHKLRAEVEANLDRANAALDANIKKIRRLEESVIKKEKVDMEEFVAAHRAASASRDTVAELERKLKTIDEVLKSIQP